MMTVLCLSLTFASLASVTVFLINARSLLAVQSKKWIKYTRSKNALFLKRLILTVSDFDSHSEFIAK